MEHKKFWKQSWLGLRALAVITVMLLTGTTVGAQTKIAYAELTDELDAEGNPGQDGTKETLTFKYGEHELGANEWDVSNAKTQPWINQSSNITHVVFDSSFADARPLSCCKWFEGCKNITSIEGIENLNTSEVTSMKEMFVDCSILTSLDLSSFDTRKVDDMFNMFNGCSSLTSLDLSNFDTSIVTNMDRMFNGCSSLTSLDLGSFDTSNVSNMDRMFNGCSSLTSLDISTFNTKNVTDMQKMFSGCSSLASLSLGEGFTVGDGCWSDYMFEDCTALEKGRLILMSMTRKAPTIKQDIFDGVFRQGTLITNLSPEQLGIDPPYHSWKGGDFQKIGSISVDYLDENGDKKTANNVLPITAGCTTLKDRWYYAEGNVNLHHQLEFGVDIHLILTDGCKMTVGTEANPINDNAIYASFNAPNTYKGITIYGQSTDEKTMGSLTVTSQHNGIYVYSDVDDAIIGITINGGHVTATGGTNGIYVKGSNGSSSVTITGGQVTANGNDNGIYADGRSASITLGWSKSTDFIKASSYQGKVKTADGKRFVAYNDEGTAASAVFGDLTSEMTISDRTVVNGKTLRPLSGYYVKDEPGLTVSGKTAPDFTISNTPYYIFKENDEVTLTTNKDYGQNGIEPNTSAAVTISSNSATTVTFAMPAADINGVRYYNTGVDYMDWDDTQKKLVSKNTADITPTAPKVYILTGGGEANLPGGWYVAKGEVSYTGRLTFHGEAHLILADGCNMTVLSDKAGVEAIFLYENLLSVYSQSGGTGSLTATGTDCGISAGDITINGGQVTATSSYHGINASNDVIINGGIVTANGNSNGILADKYVTINGGQVSATGTRGICANKGDITLGWSKSTDFIKTNKYSIPSSRSVKTVAGKPFIAYTPATDNDPEREAVLIQGKDGGVTLDENAVEALAGKVLRPAASNDDVTVKYLDAEGTEKSTTTDIVYVLQGNTNGYTSPPPGWHVAKGEVSYTGALAFNFDDEVHLILADGCQMNVGTETNPIEKIAISSNIITIYGQTNGTGTLNVYTNNKDGINAYENITINGGQVTATSSCHGYLAYSINSKNITINGGQVTATGTNAKGIYAQNITLGWSKSTDFIKASSYQGKVKTAAGKRFVAYNDEGTAASTVFGDLTSSDLTALAGKTLHPLDIITTGGEKYVSVCSTDGDWMLMDGVKAYVVTGYDTTTCTVILSEAPLDGLPNGVPVILMKDADGDGSPDGNLDPTFTLVGASVAEAEGIENSVPTTISPLFTAGDGTKTMADLLYDATGSTDTSDYLAFVLEKGVFKPVVFSESSVPAAGACILFVNKLDVLLMAQNASSYVSFGSARLRGIPFALGGDATGIDAILNGSMSNETWYDLQGRRLDQAPKAKGVYIYNGIKVVIK